MQQEQFFAIEELAQGALKERLAQEFQLLLQNVFDPNMPATDTRKIKIELAFKPNETRDFMSVVAKSSCTLAKREGIHTTVRIGSLAGQVEATELIAPQQQTIPQLAEVK